MLSEATKIFVVIFSGCDHIWRLERGQVERKENILGEGTHRKCTKFLRNNSNSSDHLHPANCSTFDSELSQGLRRALHLTALSQIKNMNHL